MWFLWIVGGLILLVALVQIVGRFMPEEYESELTMHVKQAPEVIWPMLVDPKEVSFGGKQSRGVELVSSESGDLEWEEDLGQSMFRLRMVESEPLRRVLYEGADSVVPMTMRRELRLEAADGGSLVHCTQKIVIKNGTFHVPFFRIVMSLGAGTAGMKDYLKRAASKIGEEADFR